MSADLIISVAGPGNDFVEVISAAEIEHSVSGRRSGNGQDDLGETLTIARDAVPYAALAGLLISWAQARLSREIIITTQDCQIIPAKDLAAHDLKEILRVTDRLSVTDLYSPKHGPIQ